MMQGRDQVPAHFQKKDRQGQSARNLQVTLQTPLFLFPCDGLVGCINPRSMGYITCASDRRFHCRHHLGASVENFDCRTFGRKVYRCRQHPWNCGDGLFDPTDTRGAGHAFDADFHRRGFDLVPRFANGCDNSLVDRVGGIADVGAFGG